MSDVVPPSLSELDSEIRKFVEIRVPKRIYNIRKVIQKETDKVTELFQELIKKSQKNVPQLYRDRLPECNISPKQKYIYVKQKKYQAKYQALYSDFCADYATKISKIRFLFEDCQAAGQYAICFTDKLSDFIEEKFIKTPMIVQIINRITSLNKYADYIRDEVKYPVISRQLMHDAMENFRSITSIKDDYSPPSGFDDLFICYLKTNNKESLFYPTVKKIANELEKSIAKTKEYNYVMGSSAPFPNWNSASTSYAYIAHVYNTIGSELKPENQNQATILRCAVTRHFFDLLYVKTPYLHEEFNHEKIFRNSQKIPHTTGDNLHISSVLLKEGTGKLEFKDIAKSFSDALDALSIVQFYTDPLDISYQINTAIEQIDKTIRANSGKSSDDVFLAFDDLFSLFWPLMALWPLADPVSTALFLKSAHGIKLTSSQDFARNMFVSAVEYINDYDC